MTKERQSERRDREGGRDPNWLTQGDKFSLKDLSKEKKKKNWITSTQKGKSREDSEHAEKDGPLFFSAVNTGHTKDLHGAFTEAN